MKKILLTLLMFSGIGIYAQDLEGAWRLEGQDDDGNPFSAVAIMANGFQAVTWYNGDGAFIHTTGGPYHLKSDTIFREIEFDTRDSSWVGQTFGIKVELGKDYVKIVDGGDIWKRIDDGSPGKLAGAWLFSGRKREGEIVERATDGPRKTMKILSGTRFQWIAYNTETRQFHGTGGGNYTTVDGKYTENIEFFSRDDSRVGASLDFNFEIQDGKWHHFGKNSRGEDMYEVWSRRLAQH